MGKEEYKRNENRDHLLKRAADCCEVGERLKITALGSELGLEEHELENILHGLVSDGRLQKGEQGWELTETGWQDGRALLRAHRVYESYLAEKTGLTPEQWHALADREEHRLDRESVNQISSGLNRPRYDPHGDVIPTKLLEMRPVEGCLLSEVEADGYYRIVHIEDEPTEPFIKLVKMGLFPELIVKITKLNDENYRLEWAGLCETIGESLAKNVTISVEREVDKAKLPQGNLLNLLQGGSAKIHSISPAVRGIERRRLLDLGFVPGSDVTKEGSGAFGGPERFRIRGTTQALRSEQAAKIFI